MEGALKLRAIRSCHQIVVRPSLEVNIRRGARYIWSHLWDKVTDGLLEHWQREWAQVLVAWQVQARSSALEASSGGSICRRMITYPRTMGNG